MTVPDVNGSCWGHCCVVGADVHLLAPRSLTDQVEQLCYIESHSGEHRGQGSPWPQEAVSSVVHMPP